MLTKLHLFIVQDGVDASRVPLVLESTIVLLVHEPVHTNEVDGPVCASTQRNVWRVKSVVQRGQALLAIEHNVLPVLLSALEAVNRLTRESIEIPLLPLPKQQTPDMEVQHDGAQELPDIRWPPLELPLKVRDDVAALPQTGDQGVENDLTRLLSVLHDLSSSASRKVGTTLATRPVTASPCSLLWNRILAQQRAYVNPQ